MQTLSRERGPGQGWWVQTLSGNLGCSQSWRGSPQDARAWKHSWPSPAPGCRGRTSPQALSLPGGQTLGTAGGGSLPGLSILRAYF